MDGQFEIIRLDGCYVSTLGLLWLLVVGGERYMAKAVSTTFTFILPHYDRACTDIMKHLCYWLNT